jgi:hypothetical protein
MRFRQDLRGRLPIFCSTKLTDPPSIFAPAPMKADSLDHAIIRVCAQVLAGGQYSAFSLRYFGNEDDRVDRERMARAYAMSRSPDGSTRGASFDVIVRNSNRAVERLFEVLGHESGRRHREEILKGWQNVQDSE